MISYGMELLSKVKLRRRKVRLSNAAEKKRVVLAVMSKQKRCYRIAERRNGRERNGGAANSEGVVKP